MQTKICINCGKNKQLFDFSKQADKKDGLKSWCKACTKIYAAEHYAKNKNKYIKKAIQWTENNKEKRKKVAASWKKRNRAAATADTAHYRATKDQRTPNWLSEFDLIKIKCLYQVAAMYTRESGQPWHVDHIVPLRGKQVSGLHVPWNLQVIPGEDNVRKGNRFEG